MTSKSSSTAIGKIISTVGLSLNWRLGIVFVSAVLAACSNVPKVLPVPVFEPASITISLNVSSAANPDIRGRPSPVVVRIYELRSTTSFESADFFSLNDKDQSALGADIVTRDEFFLQPGQSQTIQRKVNSTTRGIGVFVAYRDLERSKWRAVTSVPIPVVLEGKTLNQKTIAIAIEEKAIVIR
jgi:type VI secretion system protein VasD